MEIPSEAVDKYSNLTIEDTGKFMRYMGSLLTKPIETRVMKVGGSLGFTINKSVLKYLGFEEGDPVKIIIIKDDE